MVKIKKFMIFISLIIFTFFLVSCASSPTFSPKKMPELKFEKTPSYELDLSKVPKIEKPIKIWVDENFDRVDINNAKYLVLAKPEYAKFIAQLGLKKMYKDISLHQEILINQYIDNINALKEYLALERAKAEEYRQLWIDSENSYRHEQQLHAQDNAVHKTMIGIGYIGTIAALILFAL